MTAACGSTLLHGAADLHRHDVGVAGVALVGEVDLRVGLQRERVEALLELVVRGIVAGGDDDALAGVVARVVAVFAGDHGP